MAKKGKVKKAIRAAGPVISKKEMNKIVKAAGGNVQKAVNRIASVQKNAKAASKPAPAVASGAANMLIKQATPSTSFGTSKLGQTLQSMTATPAYTPPRSPNGGTMGTATAATPAQLVPGGMMIRSGGTLAVRPQPTPEPIVKTRIISKEENPPTKRETAPDPNQELLNKIADLETLLGERNTEIETLNAQPNFQELFNQQQLNYEQQMADLSTMYNQQIAGMQGMYDMQIQQQNLLAQQEQEAARAFMINQGRMMNPANLQIGATYGTPQLAGTQGFKASYRKPSVTPAQTAAAFTAPTLAATAATTPMMAQIPTVLNV